MERLIQNKQIYRTIGIFVAQERGNYQGSPVEVTENDRGLLELAATNPKQYVQRFYETENPTQFQMAEVRNNAELVLNALKEVETVLLLD